jgi:hypothetical protein
LNKYLKQGIRQTNTDDKENVYNTLLTDSMGMPQISLGRELTEICLPLLDTFYHEGVRTTFD